MQPLLLSFILNRHNRIAAELVLYSGKFVLKWGISAARFIGGRKDTVNIVKNRRNIDWLRLIDDWIDDFLTNLSCASDNGLKGAFNVFRSAEVIKNLANLSRQRLFALLNKLANG